MVTARLLLFPALLRAEETRRIPWVMDESYNGRYSNSYQKMRYEIPNILRQTVIDLAGRIGLRYQEGWRYPLVVGFDDGAPMGVENVLAYVQLYSTEEGSIKQNLIINLKAYNQEKFDFEKVLAHELVHAMLNDQLGADASTKLPLWFHEGLAVYGADAGEQLVKAYVYQFGGSADSQLFNGLEDHSDALDYAEDYLAFKYIHKKHGVNSLHNLVAEVVKRQGDIPNAVEYTCFEKWDKFLANLTEFSNQEAREIGTYRGRPGDRPKPY